MKLSAKAEYACLAVIALARRGLDSTPVRVREIAETNRIPERYLVQILIHLKGAGLVYSTRGAAGGYRLARPAEQISLREVLTAIDGPGEPPREAKEPAARSWRRSSSTCTPPSAPCSSRPRSPSSPDVPRPTIGSSDTECHRGRSRMTDPRRR